MRGPFSFGKSLLAKNGLAQEVATPFIAAAVSAYEKRYLQPFSGSEIVNSFKINALAAIATLTFATPSFADDLVFVLKNGTNSVLTHFYTSPVDEEDWEGDVFGNHTLAPGESIKITIADGRDVCDYDMRFEFQDSPDLDTTTDTQDLCELGEYTIEE